jgi:hypothetical protein
MKTTFALLVVTTAISAATGAMAAVPRLATGPVGVVADGADAPSADLTQVSDEDEDGSWFWPVSNGGGSDDSNGGGSGGGNDDECEDDDEGGAACGVGGAGNAAPAGTVAPPSNGLFTKGTAPTATTN